MNGWTNLLHVLTGAAVLAGDPAKARGWALAFGVLYTAIGVAGLVLGGSALMARGPATDALHLAVGLVALGAGARRQAG